MTGRRRELEARAALLKRIVGRVGWLDLIPFGGVVIDGLVRLEPDELEVLKRVLAEVDAEGIDDAGCS